MNERDESAHNLSVDTALMHGPAAHLTILRRTKSVRIDARVH